MNIAGYIKTSVIEWPGKITSVIFVPGCNFRCPFCHNADLVKKQNLEFFEEEKVLENLKERREWVEAVAVTGGEPTLQPDLSLFLKKLKRLEFLVMLETNGTRPKIIAKLMKEKLVDYWAMDLKGDFDNYSNYTNCPNDQIVKNVKESMQLIAKSGEEYEFRTTVVPGLHNLENLTKLANQIGEIFKNFKLKIENCHWYLQRFQPQNTLDSKFLKVRPYSKEEMESFQRHLREKIPNIFLRGI